MSRDGDTAARRSAFRFRNMLRGNALHGQRWRCPVAPCVHFTAIWNSRRSGGLMIRFLLILLLAIAAPLGAQSASAEGRRDTANASDVPDDHRPPPGMCRIWIDDVPAARQPAPTDCSTAIRRRPPNARVVFGKQLQEGGQGRARLPGVLPLVDESSSATNIRRVPAAQRDSDAPHSAEQPRRMRGGSPAPQRTAPDPERSRDPRAQAPARARGAEPQARGRRPEPRVAAPRRADPPRATSRPPAPTKSNPRPQAQRRRPGF